MHDHPNDDPLIRLPTVRKLIPLSIAQIYRLMQRGEFPRSVVLGPNARAWRFSEIEAWRAKRTADRDSGTDAPLRAINPHIGRGRPHKVKAADGRRVAS